ncbi:unnamed protein product [Polarella glacialis]|uniref:K Homology domain-containing protein n=1 Tax=Polarella glacialis TaxID=89957 RepID=A0A813DHU1_POLGL|nr:unnamed protein product [Polarella glacialis]
MASPDFDSDDDVPDDFFRSIEGRYLAELDRLQPGSNNSNNDNNDNNNNNNVAGASVPACEAAGPGHASQQQRQQLEQQRQQQEEGQQQQRRREASESQESAQAASIATSVPLHHSVSPPKPPVFSCKQEPSMSGDIQCYGFEHQQFHQQYLQQQLQQQQQQQQQQRQQHILHVLQQQQQKRQQQQEHQQQQQQEQEQRQQEQQQQQLHIATFRTGTSSVIAPDPGRQKALADKSEAFVARSSDSRSPGLQVGTAVVNRNNNNNSSSSNRTPAGDFGTWPLSDAQPSDGQRSHLQAKLLEDGRPNMVEQATLGQESPCFLKMLVPDATAEDIIGKRWYIIKDTRCSLQISRSFFLGTRLRTLLLCGLGIRDLSECVRRVLQFDVGREHESLLQCNKGRDYVFDGENDNFPVRVNIVVPDSSVSSIIGKDGRLVLVKKTGCLIRFSTPHSPMKEILMSIVGKRTIAGAVISICSILQKHTRFEQHLNLEYDVEIPMGSWLTKRETRYSKSGQVLVHPDDAAVLERGELVQHVLQAAEKDWLDWRIWRRSVKSAEKDWLDSLDWRMWKRSVKKATKTKLLDLVQEIWVCRDGQGLSQSEAITSAAPATLGPLPPSGFVAAPDLNIAQFQ